MFECINETKSYNKKYFVITYGCQMNERDTEIIKGFLENMGYQPSKNETEADVIILNTCCIREKAELKVFGKIGELNKLKRNKPDLILGICGCMVQQDEVFNKIKTKTPYVNLIFGTYNIYRLPFLLSKIEETGMSAFEIWDKEKELVEDLPSKRSDNIRASVNISYGCNNFCTYCIVPHVRGRERSRHPDSIIKEVCELAANGYKEIMLLGQNVNSYGKDLINNTYDFADLLKEINKIENLARIRYMTSHPKDFSDKLIYTISECEKVCEHYHLPIQAGSNKILQKMNRRYTKEDYLEIVNKIKQYNNNFSITTDIIVGFPGETEDDFNETLDIIEKVQFDSAYTFVYSRRNGTHAYDLPDKTDISVKNQRLQTLMSRQNQISLKKNEKLINKSIEVLVEGISKNNPNKLMGRTRTNKIVNFIGSEGLIGSIVNIKITYANTWSLVGKIN